MAWCVTFKCIPALQWHCFVYLQFGREKKKHLKSEATQTEFLYKSTFEHRREKALIAAILPVDNWFRHHLMYLQSVIEEHFLLCEVPAVWLFLLRSLLLSVRIIYSWMLQVPGSSKELWDLLEITKQTESSQRKVGDKKTPGVLSIHTHT